MGEQNQKGERGSKREREQRRQRGSKRGKRGQAAHHQVKLGQRVTDTQRRLKGGQDGGSGVGGVLQVVDPAGRQAGRQAGRHTRRQVFGWKGISQVAIVHCGVWSC
jgi:hypothetical protein